MPLSRKVHPCARMKQNWLDGVKDITFHYTRSPFMWTKMGACVQKSRKNQLEMNKIRSFVHFNALNDGKNERNRLICSANSKYPKESRANETLRKTWATCLRVTIIHLNGGIRMSMTGEAFLSRPHRSGWIAAWFSCIFNPRPSASPFQGPCRFDFVYAGVSVVRIAHFLRRGGWCRLFIRLHGWIAACKLLRGGPLKLPGSLPRILTRRRSARYVS